jgi:hypothetical protein
MEQPAEETQPQKPEKPTGIKILQFASLVLFVYSLPLLLIGIASFFDPGFACGKDEICGNVIFYNSVIMSFTVLSGLGFYSLLKYTPKLKIIGLIFSFLALFMFLASLLIRVL